MLNLVQPYLKRSENMAHWDPWDPQWSGVPMVADQWAQERTIEPKPNPTKTPSICHANESFGHEIGGL